MVAWTGLMCVFPTCNPWESILFLGQYLWKYVAWLALCEFHSCNDQGLSFLFSANLKPCSWTAFSRMCDGFLAVLSLWAKNVRVRRAVLNIWIWTKWVTFSKLPPDYGIVDRMYSSLRAAERDLFPPSRLPMDWTCYTDMLVLWRQDLLPSRPRCRLDAGSSSCNISNLTLSLWWIRKHFRSMSLHTLSCISVSVYTWELISDVMRLCNNNNINFMGIYQNCWRHQKVWDTKRDMYFLLSR